MKTELLFTPTAASQTELLVVFAADNSTSKEKDAKPEIALLTADEAIRKAASYVLTTGEFKAESNETLLLHAPEELVAARLLIVGLGKAAKATPHDLRKAAGIAVRFAKPRGIRSLAVAAPANFDIAQGVRAIAEGATLGDFDSDTYRTDRKDRSIQSLSIVVPSGSHESAAETGLREGVIIAESQNFARTLINEPGNFMTPTILGRKAAEMAVENGLKCEVYGPDIIAELGMRSFLSVAQGSEEPPALIVMTYQPEGAPAEPVLGLVGKGITFDTGGISIKPADSMEKMKYHKPSRTKKTIKFSSLTLISRNWANETGPTFARTGKVAAPNEMTMSTMSNTFMAPVIIRRRAIRIRNSLEGSFGPD